MDADILADGDLYNFLLNADPVISSNANNANSAFPMWEDLDTPTIECDPFVDRLLETLEKQEATDVILEDHCYAASNYDSRSSDPSLSPASCSTDHEPRRSNRSISESSHSSGYESNDIIETAARLAALPEAEEYEHKQTGGGVLTNRALKRVVVRASPYAQRNAQRQRCRPIANADNDEPIVKGRNNKYPALSLTVEERKYMEKEGIRLPSHYPLTKQEESLLKRIRRKIRNKKSAQTSRIKQKEYIDALEYRTDKLENEKAQLHDQVEQLAEQNRSLLEQIKQLQRTVSNGTRRTAQASTCMAVLLLSCMLVLSPSMHPMLSEPQDAAVAPANDGNNNHEAKPVPMPGRSRGLLAVTVDPAAEDALHESNWRELMHGLAPKRAAADMVDGEPLAKRQMPIKIEVDEDDTSMHAYATMTALVNDTLENRRATMPPKRQLNAYGL